MNYNMQYYLYYIHGMTKQEITLIILYTGQFQVVRLQRAREEKRLHYYSELGPTL